MIGNQFRFAAIRLGAVALIPAVVAIVSGCGDSDRLPTYSVNAKVMFPDGSTLEGAQITFQSVEHPVSASGLIEGDGTFELTTYEPGDGAVAGLHRVAVVAGIPRNVDPDEGAGYQPLIHSRFEDVDTSGLEFTVTEDGPNDTPIQVERP
jgi:hypothetical protein